MLTKNMRTHYITLTDWTVFNITKAQAELYQQEVELKKHNEFMQIEDIDTKQILFNWRCSEIKRISERQSLGHTYNAICDFWKRHPIINWAFECSCEMEFWYTWRELRDYMREKHNMIYPRDFTSEHRKEFYLYKKELCLKEKKVNEGS